MEYRRELLPTYNRTKHGIRAKIYLIKVYAFGLQKSPREIAGSFFPVYFSSILIYRGYLPTIYLPTTVLNMELKPKFILSESIDLDSKNLPEESRDIFPGLDFFFDHRPT